MSEKNNSKPKKTNEIFSGLVEYFTVSLIKGARAKAKRTLGAALKKTLAVLVLALGFIFLLVGLSQLIGRATGYGNGAGYAIVGIIVIFGAWIILTLNKK